MIDATVSLLEKVLDLRMRAHAVHVSNVSNSNVPEYKAKNIDFNEQLREAIEHLDEPSLPEIQRQALAGEEVSRVEAEVYEDPLAPIKGDGNSVNPDKEQAEIAKNTIAYQTAIQLLNKKFMFEKLILGPDGGRG